jgi:RND family efflux transporter MFP subunit
LLLLCGGCSRTVEPEAIRPVRAIQVADLAAFRSRSFPGRTEAVEEAVLSFRIAGPLVTLPVRVGEHVEKDSLLAAIDPTDYRNALDRAVANRDRARAELLAMERGGRPEEIVQLTAALEDAEATRQEAVAEHQRNVSLLSKGAISQSEFDRSLARRERAVAQVTHAEEALRIGEQGAREEDLEAKRAEIAALQAAVTDAENKLQYTTLRAPFAGDVAAKYVDNFQTAQAHQPIVRLINTSRIKVVVQVPENIISLAPLVTEARCRFDAFPDREFTARLYEIGTEATRATRTYTVTMLLDQPEDVKILPGMAATVQAIVDDSIQIGTRGISVPATAVFTPETEKQSYVWVVDGAGTVHRTMVKLGPIAPVGVTVLEGVQPGDWIVTAGVHSLREGQRVRPIEEEGGR